MKKRSKIPSFKSLEAFQEFWDKHDLTEFDRQLREVSFEVDLRARRHLVSVDPDLMRRVRQVAREKGLSTESLVNLWLQEKVLRSAS